MVQDLTSENKVGPPVLDLAPFFEKESALGVFERRRAVLEEMNKASQEWGLFQVINHGLDSSFLSEALQNAKDFFALPLEEKVKLKTDHHTIGFVHDDGVGEKWYEAESSLDKNQRFVLAMEHRAASVYNAWPETLTNFRSKMEELALQAQNTADFLMNILLQSIGLSKLALKDALKGEYYILAKYPACMKDEQVPALRKHQDAHCLTLVAQLNQVEGYQVLKDGEPETWLTVPPVKDALIVNIADILHVLTNGKYKSAIHRVLSNKKERLTFLYSHSPALKEEIAPLPEFTAEVDEPPRYRPFKYEEFYQLKIEKNITPEHFAI